MMVKRTSSVLAMLLGGMLLASPLHAQDAKAPGSSAKALYEEGVDLTNQKKFKEAEAKFLQAWALQKSYDVAANLGEVQMQQDRPAEAAVYFTYALANFPASGKKDKRDWIDGRLTAAKAKVASLAVTVNVPGAEVRLNGRPAGTAPIEGEVYAAPGECTLEVTAPDYQPFTQKLRVAAGTAQKIQVVLEAPKKSLLPAVVAGGAGVAALVTGVALYVVSAGKYDEAKGLYDDIKGGSNPSCGDKNPDPKCADLKSAAEAADGLYAPGVGLIIGGALLTAAGGAYLGYALRSPSLPQPAPSGTGARRVTVTAVGLRGTGLFVQGSF
jgi:tetratricopeptide (TPR) repeat protein